ncbi:MAG: hypothetical protein MZV70_42040 [Desulfobacterales bacterium]|nr:hypothetical protein [Desulfobacterales bacterium]
METIAGYNTLYVFFRSFARQHLQTILFQRYCDLSNTVNTKDHLEIEVKIKIAQVEALRAQLTALNFIPVQPRLFEYNVIYDTPNNH